jgi:glycine/D-amino acid oxidase-like deaminating enzyme
MATDLSYRTVSYWLDTAGDDLTPRPPLAGDADVDIAIVGAGYTGLWTAYYLAAAEPSLRIAVLERDIAGFGASGRNGGWCSALFAAPLARLAATGGRYGAVALQKAMHSTVDEVGRVAAAEGIDCHFRKGGTVSLARTPPQLARAEEEIAAYHEYGFGADDYALLGPDEARRRCHVAGPLLGATYTPHCAAIQPGRLVRGLARAVERRGVTIHEQTPVTALAPGGVTTPYGRVGAEVVVRATEAYTALLPGHRRAVAPVYSLMLATEPLPASFWDSAGLSERETFTDFRHLIIYGQRTADDRLAFGGRGAPYHFGSRIEPGHDREPRVFADLHQVLRGMFPALPDRPPAYTWGGPLAIPRDWYPSVGCHDGIARAGGYVGDGVATTNLAGRTLTDLILGRDTDLTRLPWVGHHSRRWEPEPLRWLGINTAHHLMSSADTAEYRTHRPARRASLTGRILGH